MMALACAPFALSRKTHDFLPVTMAIHSAQVADDVEAQNMGDILISDKGNHTPC